MEFLQRPSPLEDPLRQEIEESLLKLLVCLQQSSFARESQFEHAAKHFHSGYVRLTFHFQHADQEQFTLGMSHPVSGLRYILHDAQVKLVNEAVFALLMDEQVF